MKKITLAAAVLVCGLGVRANAAPLLADTFSYGAGPTPISTASGGAWAVHSGTDSGTTALNIVDNAAVINQGDTHGSGADVNRALSSTFDATTDNSSTLYSSFTVNFGALPVSGDSDGSYFAHFKSSAANEFYSRIGANTNGAASGSFRLAVANETWSVAASVEYPLDLSLNTTYIVVSKLDLSTDTTTLWINPTSEASTSVTATDTISYATGAINAYALRQGTSGTGAPGILTVDNLLVGTTFADVVSVPEPTSLALVGLVGLVGLRRHRRRP